MKLKAEELLEKVVPYPTTQSLRGDPIHAEKEAIQLYDQWVCDRRWRPIDVVRMILAESLRRGIYINIDDL